MNLLYLTILLPLLSCLILVISFYYFSEKVLKYVGISGIGLSMLLSIIISLEFFEKRNNEKVDFFSQTLWNWISIHDFNISFTLYLDQLSLLMLLMITIVGFLIQLYATWYIRGKEKCSRYFIYINLFIANMLLLVLSDNLLFMYIGWEGVGFCSYILIGFYHDNPKNCNAAIRTFIITHIGDVILLCSFLIIYNNFGTLNFKYLNLIALKIGNMDYSIIFWITLMILCGSISKSAQVPLHTWLIDAMVGPTPVSALIHAATMVTSGVYLIIRTYNLFLISTIILNLVSFIGLITLIVSGIAAITENNIKKILAYSTMSQVGYMFLALGVHACDSAVFHLIIHSFFKALLFLTAGSIIVLCYNRQNILKIRGLKELFPSIYFYFLIGSISLSGFPLLTSGFYSKDKIILDILNNGNITLTILGLVGIFITSIYIFRVIFIVFYGKTDLKDFYYCHNTINHHLPLFIFSILSTFIGILVIYPYVKRMLIYSNNYIDETIIIITSSFLTLIGIYLSSRIWLKENKLLIKTNYTTKLKQIFINFCSYFHTYRLNNLYDNIFVNLYFFIIKLINDDPLNKFEQFLKFLTNKSGIILNISVNSNLRWYIKSLILGTIIILLIVEILIY